MGVTVRKAAAPDAPAWLELLKPAFDEYPDKQVLDAAWVASQLEEAEGIETWVAELDGKLQSAISFLPPSFENNNPVANIGRHLNAADSYSNGAAEALMRKVVELASERKQLLVSRILASDTQQQILYEKAGFSCVGFQPIKHTNRVREGALFYCHITRHDIGNRVPISESLPQVAELAGAVLASFSILKGATSVRDGVTGYPLQSELQVNEGSLEDFEIWQIQAQAANPPVEISGAYNQGGGYFRTTPSAPPLSLLGWREGTVVAALLYMVDPTDRCARLVDSFSKDDIAAGALLHEALKLMQQKHDSLYVEMDVLATAPRLLKSAEQLGFVPVAYFPAIYSKAGSYADVIKLVKLNISYSLEHVSPTASAKSIVTIIDAYFEDQKIGVGIINLLRELPFFDGLGDGELRKIARLFTQKLFRAGERIFNKGDSGNEAYVVMRGQIDILLDEGAKPLANIGNGQIFGELAFLANIPRTASAMAAQPSIVLVVQRSAFNRLVEHEPHLGMVVMKNIAIELSNRLKKANIAIAAGRH
jgi:CRP/FNR family cyclic AMP-dependent transcriptional regulator